MKVSDLAAELGIPASAVLEQCQRFSIDATWAGAELKGADVVILRAELADADSALDLTPADEPVAATTEEAPADDAAPTDQAAATDDEVVDHAEAPTEAVPVTPDAAALAASLVSADASGPATMAQPAVDPTPAAGAEPPASGPDTQALPPTAVASIPGLIDAVTPEPDLANEPTGGLRTGGATKPDPSAGPRRIPPREAPAKKKLDRAARNSPIWLVIGIALFVGSNYVENVFAVTALWLLALVAFLAALIDGVRGRRHVQVHPERLWGTPIAIVSLVLAVGALIGLASAVVAVVRDEPAADAPLGVGDLESVQAARWGYQRMTRLADDGWKSPVREAGSCWLTTDKEVVQDEQREEYPEADRRVGCNKPHTIEVADTFAYNREADAPYPGFDAFEEMAETKCGPTLTRVSTSAGTKIVLIAEYPSEAGWNDGDHDVACLFVTGERSAKLAG